MNVYSIIPSGNGGINSEGRTLKEIAEKPVPEALLAKVESLGIDARTVAVIRRDVQRMGRGIVPAPAIGGRVDFSGVAWPEFLPKLPDAQTLGEMLRERTSGQPLSQTTPEMIRAITYDIGRKALAERYGITKSQAERLVGLLDCVFHETEDGRLQIVPNNIHRFKNLYAHKGYVSEMMKQFTGAEVEGES